MFHQGRHEKALEKKFKHYQHTVTPLDLDIRSELKNE
jgi:hypothetical protein